MGMIDWLRSLFTEDEEEEKVKEPAMAVAHGIQEPPMAVAHSTQMPIKESVGKSTFTPEMGVKKLIEHEGFRIDPYVDSEGYITGGIGHKFTKEDFDNFDKTWPKAKKMEYWQTKFDEDLDKAETHAKALSAAHGIEPTPANLYVLTDMTFNLGVSGVGKFKNFLADMSEGNVDGAIKEMKFTSKDSGNKSKWYQQVPNRVDSLAEILRSSNESS